MLIELRRPYVDVSAGDLSLTLGLATAPALEVLALDGCGGRAIELRLLGFSHQVLVGGGSDLSETVACVPASPERCPSGARTAHTASARAWSASRRMPTPPARAA